MTRSSEATLVASAGTTPMPPPRKRRAEALDRLRAKYPHAGYHLDPPGRVEESPAQPLPASSPTVPAARATPAPLLDRLLAGHLLRRIGFGPTLAEVASAMKMGAARYVDWQLNYANIDDSAAAKRLPPPPKSKYDDCAWIRRWYTRMVYSRRQLLERMTLIWHEHFATSNEKVGVAFLMAKQEILLRKYALKRFRDLLVNLTKDQAMLLWLDNDYNNGNSTDDEGNYVPPNANYAREFLQLFTMGPVLLNMDGTPKTDASGVPLPSYTEEDVKEVARALTGWRVEWEHERYRYSIFEPWMHDSGEKTVLGVTLPGRSGKDGAREVEDVVDIVLAHPNTAPFISKILVQKLCNERPSPAYVERVATVFRDTGGDLKQTVRAILLDPEFNDPSAVRTQWKEPIEHFTLPVRALSGVTKGDAFIDWTFLTKQLLYYPPSVFSFYPPGGKRQLVTTATVTYRDRGVEELVTGWWGTYFKPDVLIKKYKLTTPELTVDFLADALLVAPLAPEVRTEIVAYMDGRVDDEKFRGAVWLLLASPDYQRN
jgi:uncharacterized protein (DUF1800 family)